ncbi:MAG: hypothetical protein JWO77_3459 [Ilumatobacteraceae bacterium]|nr:hypothetical protein [Ilumatobacteraceae bacterium]
MAVRDGSRRTASSGLLLIGLLAGALAFLLAGSGASGAGPTCTKTWTSAADGHWANPALWSPAGVPTAADDVCITVSGTYTVVATGSQSAKSLQVGSSGAGLATVEVQGVGCTAAAALDISTTAEVFARGRVDLTSAGCSGTSATLSSGAGVTNDGSLRMRAGNGGTRSLRGGIINRGSASVAAPTEFDQPGSAFDNRGSVTLTDVLTARAGTTVVGRSGSITASGSGRFTVNGATFDQRGGTTSGAPVELLNAALTSTGAGSPASFVAHQSGTIAGTIGSGQSVLVEGLGCSYATAIDAPANVTNAGSITLSSGGCGGTTAVLQGAGLLTNTSTGTISSAAGNGGTRHLRIDVRNQGSVVVGHPTAFDAAGTTFDNRSTVTLTQPLTVTGASFTNASGSVASSGAGAVRTTAGGTFTQGDGSTTGSPVEILNSTLAFTPTSSGSSQFDAHQNATLATDVPAPATVTVEGLGCSYTSQLTATGPFANAGTIRLTSGGCGGTSAVLSAPGLITNTGTITVAAGNGGARYLRADVRNQGTLAVAQPLSFDGSGTTFANEGTVTLTQPMTASASTVRNVSGSIDGTGAGQLTTSSGVFQQGNGDTSGNPVVVLQSQLTFLSPSTGTSEFTAHQNVVLSGDVPAGASLTIEGLGCSYATEVTAAGAFTNAGSIRFTSGGCGGTYASLTGGGLLTNTGSIVVLPGNGGARYLRMDVRNRGSVAVDQPLSFDGSGTTFANEGTVALTEPMTTSGATVRNLAGSIGAAGTGQLTVTDGAFQQGDGDTSGSPVVVLRSDLTYLTPSTGTSAFTAHQSVVLAGDLPASTSLTIEGVGCSYATEVTATGPFTNAGTIRFTSGGCGGTYALLTGTGLITNSGTIDVDAGNGGARYLRASVLNQGTVTVDQPLSFDSSGSTFTNRGTVTLNQSATTSGATVRNESGSIDATGGVLTVADGAFVQSGGDTSGAAVVTLRSSLSFVAPGSGTSGFVMHQSGQLSGPIPAGAAIAIEGVGCSYATTVTASGSLVNAGTISLTSGGCGGTASSLAVAGTLVNSGTLTAEPGNGGSRTITATQVDNTGTLHLQTGAPITIDGPLVLESTGTLLVDVDGVGATGRLTTTGPVSFGGALETTTTFVPPFGSTFPVVTYPSSSGTFGTLGTAGTQYSVDYQPTQMVIAVLKVSSVVLSATPPGPTVAGQAITLTATVTAVAPDTGTPTGPVEFLDGATSLGTAALDGAGQAQLAVTDLPVGNRSVTARYLGAATFGRSTSSPLARTVTRASTGTFLGSSPNPSAASQDVTFTATVAVVAPGAGSPSGTVTFKEGASVLGTAPVGSGGVAELTTATLHVGTHTVVASYAGDARFAASTSAPIDQRVTGTIVHSTTTLTAPEQLVATQVFDLTARVQLLVVGGTPPGEVAFHEGALLLGTAPVRSDGTAVLPMPRGLGGGTHRIAATYLGTPSIDPSTSPEEVLVVGRAGVTFVVSASLDPTRRGVVRFIVQASVTAPASSAPAGPILLRDGGETVAEGRLVDGRAVLERCFIPACEEPPPTTTTTSAPTTTSTPAPTSTTAAPTTTTAPPTTTTTAEVPTTTAPTGTTTTIEVPRMVGRDGGSFTVRPPTGDVGGLLAGPRRQLAVTRQLVASYAGDDDFAAYDSDPIAVEVDGDTVTLPAVVPPTTTAPPTTAPPTTAAPTTAPPTTAPATVATTSPLTGDPGERPARPATPVAENPAITGSGAEDTGDPDARVAGAEDQPGGDESAAPSRIDQVELDGDETDEGSGISGATPGTGPGSGSAGSGDSGRDGDDGPRSLSAEFGRSTLSSHTATPKQVSTDPVFVFENLVLTLFLLLLSTYPAYLFNNTLAAHYDEVIGWLGPVHRRIDRVRARRGSFPVPVVMAASAAAGAFLFGMLDPNLGLNMASFALLLGLAASIILISGVYDVARSNYMERHYGVASSLRGYPAGLVVAAVLVLVSRVAHFQPGYLFGVFTALGFATKVEQRDDGKGVAVASLWLLALATACWFLWIPVADAASEAHAGFVPLFLDATLATTWVVGIQTLVFGLMPLRFLDGEKVKAWSRTGWAAIYGLGMFAFVHSMIRPGTEVDGDSFATALVLFAGFTVFAVAFWGYFRFRAPRPDEGSTASDGPADEALVDA